MCSHIIFVCGDCPSFQPSPVPCSQPTADWMLLASRHEFSDRCAERAVAIVEAFNSRKVMFAFLDQQFSTESMCLTCLVVFRCQPSYFRCFLGATRDNEWRTRGRDFETRALTNNHFMGQLQSRLQIGIGQSAKIVDTADGDAAFDHIVRQAVVVAPVGGRKRPFRSDSESPLRREVCPPHRRPLRVSLPRFRYETSYSVVPHTRQRIKMRF
jgi:hypothetical protein